MQTLRWTLLAVAITVGCSSALADSAPLDIQRLTWAGLRLQSGETTVFVDAMATDIWNGSAPGGFVAAAADTRRRYALLTHLHNDHFDAAGLKEVLGERGYVICHESVASHVASRGHKVIPATLYHPIVRGGFVFTAVPAEDGLGDTQVSWVIRHGEQRYLHGGDSLWHGQLETIGAQLGPFDAAFLPINGARLGDARVGAVMTPLQAVEAARLLSAARLVPIHYGFSDPPGYREVASPLRALAQAAENTGVEIVVLEPGDRLRPREE